MCSRTCVDNLFVNKTVCGWKFGLMVFGAIYKVTFILWYIVGIFIICLLNLTCFYLKLCRSRDFQKKVVIITSTSKYVQTVRNYVYEYKIQNKSPTKMRWLFILNYGKLQINNIFDLEKIKILNIFLSIPFYPSASICLPIFLRRHSRYWFQ